MKRILATILSLLLTAGLVEAQKTIKDENVELRQASGFHGIKVSGGFDVYLSSGNEESVAVSASQKEYVEYIKAEVRDGILHIEFKPRNGKWNIRNLKLSAYISYKNLDKLVMSGATDVRLMDIWKADKVSIDLSGASDLKGEVKFEELDIEQSGASDADIRGTVRKLQIRSSGASNFKGYGLNAHICDARASGASDIRITVNSEISVDASGASDVFYRGEGHIRDIRTSGASTVARR